MDPLLARVVCLLWSINDDSARNYRSWVSIGNLLYTLDNQSAAYELAWRWWSRKYGNSSYKESDWTGERRKWPQLRSVSSLGNQRDLLVALAHKAKQAAGGSLHYSTDTVQRALQEFVQECSDWFGRDPLS